MRAKARRAGEHVRRHAERFHLSTLVLCVSVALCVAYTSLNARLARDAPRQSVLAAAFCVIACGMYLAFMVMSRLVGMVLGCVEGHGGGYEEVGGGGANAPYDDDDEPLLWSAIDGEEPQPAEPAPAGGYPFVQLLAAVNTAAGKTRASRREQALAAVHRDAVISSMYLGGCGAFTALLPLCMWDMSASVCFVAVLAFIGFLAEDTKVSEYKPNVDRAGAITRLRLLHTAVFTSVGFTLAGVLWQDVHGTRADSIRVATQRLFANPNNTVASAASIAEQEFIAEEMAMLQWPFMIIAAASPVALRIASAPNAETRAQKLAAVLMTPSQTLEAGLPVSTLLAVLVLCWYSPVDALVMHEEILSRAGTPMMILCPPCLAITLALLLRGFRQRQTIYSCAILAIACAVRQQAVDRGMRTRPDMMVIGSAAHTAAALAAWAMYRRSVVADGAQHAPGTRAPLPTLVEEDEPKAAADDGEMEEVAVV